METNAQVNKRLGELATEMTTGEGNDGEWFLEEEVAHCCKTGKQIDIGGEGAKAAIESIIDQLKEIDPESGRVSAAASEVHCDADILFFIMAHLHSLHLCRVTLSSHTTAGYRSPHQEASFAGYTH